MRRTLTPEDAIALRPVPPDIGDFSLVLGGPLFQLFQRTHLSGAGLDLLWRRVIFISLLCWLPLVALSTMGGHLVDGTTAVPFFLDLEVQIRFLVAVPLLVGA